MASYCIKHWPNLRCFFFFWIIQGYVIVDSFFKKEELDACRDAIDVLVDDLANMLYTGNKIKSKSSS